MTISCNKINYDSGCEFIPFESNKDEDIEAAIYDEIKWKSVSWEIGAF